jgi:hypothetical protein
MAERGNDDTGLAGRIKEGRTCLGGHWNGINGQTDCFHAIDVSLKGYGMKRLLFFRIFTKFFQLCQCKPDVAAFKEEAGEKFFPLGFYRDLSEGPKRCTITGLLCPLARYQTLLQFLGQ